MHPVGRIRKSGKMEAKKRLKEEKNGRPKKPVKRETTTGIRFSKAEYFVIKQKASKSGLRMTAYIRQMALQGQVIAKMNDEERQFVRDLVGMSNNINQLAKKAHQEGLLKALLLFETYRDQLDLLLQRIKK
jgi:hypothetical protein